MKLLRKRRGRTQDETAFSLGLKRPTLSGYENAVAQPDIDTLIAFSQYYKIAIDTLVKADLSALPESQLSQLEKGFDVYISGSQLRVLTTTVNTDNKDNIELVGEKAKAGYASGFADPEFISVLPTFQLPFLHKERKYRTFQINGDSMLPIPHGSWVTGEYVQNWNLIRNRHAYLIVTREEGVVFKVVENLIQEEAKLTLHSLNPAYDPFDIPVKDIREVWKFIHYISSELPEPNLETNDMARALRELKQEVKAIQIKLDL
ncbi:MAG: helix-turn-helix domain-containing protein [Bacteroidetes bacterium]|nr:helix-turn-helix domain-containing protein [Bacteroidota bacterium]